MEFRIADRPIGGDNPVFVIAELSANHNQNYDTAVETVKAASRAGADAIKLQTYTPDTMTIDSDRDDFRIKQGTIWDGKTLYQLYQNSFMPWEWQKPIKTVAEGLGLVFLSTPYDRTAVDFLETLQISAYKVASFEITDIPLIQYIASKGKPVMISTGIALLCDIELAVNACRKMGNDDIALLKCTSTYPSSLEELNLKAIPYLETAFNTVTGLSDHTRGDVAAIASVALGAKIIEKHFTLDRALGGPDALFSLNPKEFKRMVDSIRAVEKALGDAKCCLTEKTQKSRELARSLYVVKDIREGELFSSNNVRSIRPGFGLHPQYLENIYGKKAREALKKGTPLQWIHVEK